MENHIHGFNCKGRLSVGGSICDKFNNQPNCLSIKIYQNYYFCGMIPILIPIVRYPIKCE